MAERHPTPALSALFNSREKLKHAEGLPLMALKVFWLAFPCYLNSRTHRNAKDILLRHAQQVVVRRAGADCTYETSVDVVGRGFRA